MTEEKNKVTSANVMISLIEITLPGADELARVTDNNENVTWNGETWLALNLKWDEILESSKGEIPRVDMSICNIGREMERYIQAYDLWTKINGFSPVTANFYVVNSGNLANTTPELDYSFMLSSIRSNAQWVTFTLGAPSPYARRFPLDRILKNHCRVRKFKDVTCNYSGAETSCDRTLKQCRLYNNSTRFGGFPGVGNTAVRI